MNIIIQILKQLLLDHQTEITSAFVALISMLFALIKKRKDVAGISKQLQDSGVAHDVIENALKIKVKIKNVK